MRHLTRRWVPVCVIVTLLPCAMRAQKNPAATDVIQAAADYLTKYSRQLGVIAAEEEFQQYDVTSGKMGTPVRLTNDVVIFGNGLGQARTFRDLAAVDSRPVRTRDDRLLLLMKGADEQRLARADETTDAAVRRYITPDLHGLDDPFLALEFLRTENQARSTFKIDGTRNMNGAAVAIVKFTEQKSPRLIPSPEEAPAVGKFWIETATGVVRQTEMSLTGRSSNFHCIVKYARDAGLDLWLPSELDQETRVSAAGTGMNTMGGGGGYGATGAAEGHSTFTKYRR